MKGYGVCNREGSIENALVSRDVVDGKKASAVQSKIPFAARLQGDVAENKTEENFDRDVWEDDKKLAWFGLACCFVLFTFESTVLFPRLMLGFNEFNTPYFWTELALTPASFAVTLLAFRGVAQPDGAGLIAPFLAFLPPRIAVFYYFVIELLTRRRIASETAFLCISIPFVLIVLCFALSALWMVHRYYRRSVRAEAVRAYLGKVHSVAP